jgi:hypothetical protein
MRRKPKAKLYLRFRTPDGKQSPYCPGVIFVSLQDSEELDWHVAVRGAATLKWLQPA